MLVENIIVKVSKEFKEEIKKQADKEYKTLSDYIRNLIIEDIRKKK